MFTTVDQRQTASFTGNSPQGRSLAGRRESSPGSAHSPSVRFTRNFRPFPKGRAVGGEGDGAQGCRWRRLGPHSMLTESLGKLMMLFLVTQVAQRRRPETDVSRETSPRAGPERGRGAVILVQAISAGEHAHGLGAPRPSTAAAREAARRAESTFHGERTSAPGPSPERESRRRPPASLPRAH